MKPEQQTSDSAAPEIAEKSSNKSKKQKKIKAVSNKQPKEQVLTTTIVSNETKQEAVSAAKDETKTVTKHVVKETKSEPTKSEPTKSETVKTAALDEIWNAIKDRELGLFGLSGQTIAKYCTPINIEPSKCLLKYKVSSVIPALESVVSDFNFEVMNEYLVVSKKQEKKA